MSAPLSTRYLTPSDYDAWEKLVSQSAEGSVYSLPGYLDALCEVTRGKFRILAAEQNGELQGGVALYERPSRWGTFVSTRLLLYYNGFVLRPYESKYPSEQTARRNAVLGALEAELSKAGYSRLRLKSRSPLSDIRVFRSKGWISYPTYTYVVPIADLTKTWGLIEQNLRRLIQRCEREGMQFTDDDDFDSFYRMHRQTHERKGAPLQLPEKEFRTYFQKLRASGLAKLYHARIADGRSISAQLVLVCKHGVTHTVSAGQDPEFARTGSSAFLRWKGFQELSRMGYTANDLTDADLNPVTHFKSQFGGDLELSLVVHRPDSLGLRLEESAMKWRYRAGGLARASLHRLRNLKTPVVPEAKPTSPGAR